MSIANPLWGAPRIHGELLKLGIAIGQTSVAKYMAKPRGPPSLHWRMLTWEARTIVQPKGVRRTKYLLSGLLRRGACGSHTKYASAFVGSMPCALCFRASITRRRVGSWTSSVTAR
jgi:hypothetical protein